MQRFVQLSARGAAGAKPKENVGAAAQPLARLLAHRLAEIIRRGVEFIRQLPIAVKPVHRDVAIVDQESHHCSTEFF